MLLQGSLPEWLKGAAATRLFVGSSLTGTSNTFVGQWMTTVLLTRIMQVRVLSRVPTLCGAADSASVS